MTTILKLGGSVITEKNEAETLAEERLARAAAAVAEYGDLVVVHGGGSFGHHHAAASGVTTTAGTLDATTLREIHGAMTDLNDAVVAALAERGAPAVPVHPLSAMYRSPDGERTILLGQVGVLHSEGFLPVLHGDMVAHRGRGATVVSGDELVVALADGLGADRIGVCSMVPGVLDGDGEVIEHVSGVEAVGDALTGSDTTDVTGGMAGKVRELVALDAPAHIFDLDGLDTFLDGGSPGTRID